MKACYIESKLTHEVVKKFNAGQHSVDEDEIDFEINNIYSHNLLKITNDLLMFRKNEVQMTETILLELSDDERVILDLFSESILWEGRYPIPKDRSQYNTYLDKTRKAWRPINEKSMFKRLVPERAVSFENYQRIYKKIEKFYLECSG